MSLALLTKPDVQMYSALEQLPRELDGKFLSVTEFRTHFKSFYGRPVQDIIEALHRYSREALLPDTLNKLMISYIISLFARLYYRMAVCCVAEERDSL